MENDLLLRKLVNDLDLMDNLFDYIRLIDPVKKRILAYSKKTIENLPNANQKCYSFFGRATVCDNCISMRALQSKKSIVKIEYADPSVYLVTSVPVMHEGTSYAVELFKDITNDGFIDVDGKGIEEIKQMVQQINSLVVRDSFTRIYNENYISSRLPHDIFRSQDEKRKLALFLISIRNLKEINTFYGLNARNGVIKGYASVIKNYIRKPEDWTACFGSTEFIIVLYDIEETQANRICKRVHDKLDKIELQKSNKPSKVEFKIGFHILENESVTAKEFIASANENIYIDTNHTTINPNPNAFEDNLPQYLLSDREKEVAKFLLEGKTNQQISQSLFIGLSTVKKHIANIFDKAQVKSRSEFIAKIKGNLS